MRTSFLLLLTLVTLDLSGHAQSPAPVPAAPVTDPATFPPATADVSPASAADNARILEKFAKVQKDFDVRKKEIANTALAKFTSGAMSENAAVQFYFTCEQIVQDRMPVVSTDPKEDAKQRQERMKRESEEISDTPGRAAVLQLQLQYLVLTMEAPGYKDRGALISRLKDFANRAVGLIKTYSGPPVDISQTRPAGKGNGNNNNNKRDMEKQRELQREERSRRQVVQLAQQNAMGSVFAHAYNLTSYFKPMEGWPESPLALASAYNGMILPYYRENKKEFLGPAWDEYLNLEASIQRYTQDDRGYARWGIGAYKNLQWSKWIDLLHNGVNRVMAADELSKLCSENPTHPSVGGWIEQLAGEILLLNGGGTPAPLAEKVVQ